RRCGGRGSRCGRRSPPAGRVHGRRARRCRHPRRDGGPGRGRRPLAGLVRPAPLAAAGGLLVDRVVGDPPDRWHPVAWFGTAMTGAERLLYRDTRAAGVAHTALGLGLAWRAGRTLPSPTLTTAVAAGGAGLTRAARR